MNVSKERKTTKLTVFFRVSLRVKRCAVAITLLLIFNACSSGPEVEIPLQN